MYTQKDNLTTAQSRASMEIVRLIFVASSWMTPIITFLPLMIFFQLFGDFSIGLMLIVFWIGPLAVSFAVTIEKSNNTYFPWMFLYLVPLIGIIFYELARYGFTSSVVNILQNPDFYCELAAEVGLASVVISDIFYSNLSPPSK